MRIIRNDYNRWILQKNINNKQNFIEFLSVLKDVGNQIDYNEILAESQAEYSYKGRSKSGSASTMGVRMSQINFYMFGYKSSLSDEFFPTPISEELLRGRIDDPKLILGNLFMMQFPHPNSTTSSNVDLFFGRLIIKLLLDDRIDRKLYTDELFFIMPFIRKINASIYEELVKEIIRFRNLDFCEKKFEIMKVENYESFFAKIIHEMIYYFIRIFIDFGVFIGIEDMTHNEGNLFLFNQGKDNTKRRDAIKSGGKYPGYIEIDPELIDLSSELLNIFKFDDDTFKLGNNNILSNEDLHNDMFINQAYKILNIISPEFYINNEIVEVLETMRLNSINSPDGKAFEKSLLSVFKEFDESYSARLLSGSGQTDIFCIFQINGRLCQFNVEAKSGGSGNNVNVIRILRHLDQTKAEYCLMVAPRFSRGTYLDINNTKISTITSETLYQYCMSMLIRSGYRQMPYSYIDNFVKLNPGKRIDYLIEKLLTTTIDL